MFLFFFFKQKTAYEMRISDWSSDVCSSDLTAHRWSTPAASASPERNAMSEAAIGPSKPAMNTFERWLTLWVALCIIVGIALGHWLPGVFQLVAADEADRVNLPVAGLAWRVFIPLVAKLEFAALARTA